MIQRDVVACLWLSARWLELIQAGYSTAIVGDDNIAIMWRGPAGRDHVRNVMGVTHAH